MKYRYDALRAMAPSNAGLGLNQLTSAIRSDEWLREMPLDEVPQRLLQLRGVDRSPHSSAARMSSMNMWLTSSSPSGPRIR